ncbi:YhdH/YhfP-type quinone oxidoreductase [Gaiella occulta]|uniref:YhdH/YhfP-type quinone oxidoreductase n=1 Tax=Gaiella occulta TaxID=1002870 RepID=A0A7M2YW65_9ACTN|nr:oxidoreductase [Gaiella occulta]RDI74373.1 YhdH/YhfP-type quinone oxidoreductase [Gaiella occulta]
MGELVQALGVPARFRGFVAERTDDRVETGIRELSQEDLADEAVTVRVAWSSVNYKDGLACSPHGRVARISPLVPGIDLAGEVVASTSPRFRAGDLVVAHGYEIGTSHHGGFAEYARLPDEWVVPLPQGLSTREAIAIGTAGFTAALSVHQLESRGLEPVDGPILVTGASGGVGSTAVAILAARGYEVVASTGKEAAREWLRELGAARVLGREEIAAGPERPLGREEWAAAVDCVGGSTLAGVLGLLRYGGAVAACGLTGGRELSTTVLPFILRGVALLGTDSVQCPLDLRTELWGRIAGDLRPRKLERIVASEIELEDLEPSLAAILRGEIRGRTLVRCSAETSRSPMADERSPDGE